jgi:hypothetical protein
MKRYGYTVTSRQWRAFRLNRYMLRELGAHLDKVNFRCVLRKGRKIFPGVYA